MLKPKFVFAVLEPKQTTSIKQPIKQSVVLPVKNHTKIHHHPQSGASAHLRNQTIATADF